jgi:hypothetical protein
MLGEVKSVQYFGLSYDEPRRVSKVRNRFEGTGGDLMAFSMVAMEVPRLVPSW